MLWLILGILLFLWTLRFGFGAGGFLVIAVLIGLWLVSIILLLFPLGRRDRRPEN
jgi:hypothetical protein